MEEKASSPLIPPPSEIDLEAGGGGEQLQCRICLETDGEGGSAVPAGLARAVAGCVFLNILFPLIVLVEMAGRRRSDWLCGCACAGRDFIAPCKCKGTSKYVHRDCLDHWRSVKVSARCSAYSVTAPPLCAGGCSGIAK